MTTAIKKFPIIVSLLTASLLAINSPLLAATDESSVQLIDESSNKNIYQTRLVKAPDGTSEIVISFDGFPVQPKITKIDSTKQILLDFGTINFKDGIPTVTPTPQVKSFYITRALDNHTVLVINLDKAGKISSKTEKGNYIVKVYPDDAAQVAAINSPVPVSTTISDVTFNRNGMLDDNVQIILPSPETGVDVKASDRKLVLSFKNAAFPKTLLTPRYFNDAKAFIVSSSTRNEGTTGIIEINVASAFDYQVYQYNNELAVKFTRKAITSRTMPQPTASPIRSNGKRISLDFQNVDTRRILQLLSGYAGANIVTSDAIKGTISIKVVEVPWETALRVILKTAGLTQRIDGDVIVVAPTEELAKDDENLAKVAAQSIALQPTETTFFQLNYAVASEVAALIKATQTNNGMNGSSNQSGQSGIGSQSGSINTQWLRERLDANGENSGSLLSPRGSVSVDSRTNTLIVNDTAQKIAQIRRIISQIDVPVRQVMVEAKIVHASTDFAKALGVKWGLTRTGSTLISNNATNLNTLYNNQSSGTASSITNNVNLDLGSSVSALGVSNIAFGLINTSSTLLNLELAALQTSGNGEVLSAPRVMTGDKQPAVIRSGSKIPYQTSSGNLGTTTSFQDAVLELSVTPSITPDGNVQMKLSINKDTLGIPTSSGYVIDTNKLDTNVLVGDGETVVLGGFYEKTQINGESKVPGLSNAPAVGGLFKSKRNESKKQELLIFITPKIVAQGSQGTI